MLSQTIIQHQLLKALKKSSMYCSVTQFHNYFGTKTKRHRNLSIQHVRELLRPFISAVHPDRHHGPKSIATRDLNEESLKSLNGFLDMAEARSLTKKGSVIGTLLGTCEPTYKFAFNDVKSSSSLSSVNVVVKIPAALLETSTISTQSNKQWLQLVAGCAVKLLKESQMKIPKELYVAQQDSNSNLRNGNQTSPPGLSYNQIVNPKQVAEDAEWAREETFELTRQYAERDIVEEVIFRTTNGSRYDEDEAYDNYDNYDDYDDYTTTSTTTASTQTTSTTTNNNDGNNNNNDSNTMDEELLHELQVSVVNKLFQSQRISIAASATQLNSKDVMKAAGSLRTLLLEYYQELNFGHPKWSCVLFVLGDQKKCHYTLLNHGNNVVVKIPCRMMLEKWNEESEMDDDVDTVKKVLQKLKAELMMEEE